MDTMLTLLLTLIVCSMVKGFSLCFSPADGGWKPDFIEYRIAPFSCDNTLKMVEHWAKDSTGKNIRICAYFVYRQLQESFYVKCGDEVVYITTKLIVGCTAPHVCLSRGKTEEEALNNLNNNLPEYI